MLVDLRSALGENTAGLTRTGPSTAAAEEAGAANKGLLIYSGHDSTLVPVLCALGIYDGNGSLGTLPCIVLKSLLEICQANNIITGLYYCCVEYNIVSVAFYLLDR